MGVATLATNRRVEEKRSLFGHQNSLNASQLDSSFVSSTKVSLDFASLLLYVLECTSRKVVGCLNVVLLVEGGIICTLTNKVSSRNCMLVAGCFLGSNLDAWSTC